MKRIVVAGLALVVMAGCSTTPDYNEPLTAYSPDYGYRFGNVKQGDNSDDLFIVLTFSGGGTRASALSLGVLEHLANTEIEWNGRRCRLLDEVDVISSVSGGSFTAAYYAAFGDGVFTDFAEQLYEKRNSMLLKLAFALPNVIKQASPFYSRTNTAANEYSTEDFKNVTFRDLLANRGRPFVVINATDMGLRRQFSFTQPYFDLIYSDLSTYPLGNAVAASSAYPGAFSALLLKNHPSGDDFELDPWIQQRLAPEETRSTGHLVAVDAQAYQDPGKVFVHLSDGGVSDNLGLVPIILSLREPDNPFNVIPPIPAGSEQKVVIIVVNALPRAPDTLSYGGRPPRLFKLLQTAGSTPMTWFTNAQLLYLELLLEQLKDSDADPAGEDPSPGTNAARRLRDESPRRFYLTEVGFEKLIDAEERQYFETIPTSFTLEPEMVDRLREVGGEILAADPVFQELLRELSPGLSESESD